MMGSLFSSISGLKNHTTWMNVVGNNISNVNTVGYKETRITFKEAISQSLGAASGANLKDNLGGINPMQQGLGSVVGSLDTIMTQGAIQTTGNPTDVAIQGTGFFVLKNGNTTEYTRAGNFYFDNSGDLVSSNGSLVQGWNNPPTVTPGVGGPPVPLLITQPTQPNTNTPMTNVNIPQNMILGPKATGDKNVSIDPNVGIFLKGNLDNNTPQNPLFPGPLALAYPAVGYVPDAVTSATVYDSLGTAHVIVFDWTQINLTPGLPAIWNWAAYDTGSNGQLPIPVAGTAYNPGVNAQAVGNGLNITFNADGSLATDGAVAPNIYPVINIINTNGANQGAPQGEQISVFLGTPNQAGPPPVVGKRDGITGDFGGGTIDSVTNTYIPKQTIYTSFVDGYEEGTLTGVSVDATGGVNCSFSNNQIVQMAKIGMALFANPQGLQKAGGTMFLQSANSGLAQVTTAGSSGAGIMNGGALEASNVDLSVELTNMIIAQRGFEANARIVTTSSDMLNTLVQLGR